MRGRELDLVYYFITLGDVKIAQNTRESELKKNVLNNTKSVIELPESKVNLMPGANLVDAEIAEKAENHPTVGLWVKAGHVAFKELEKVESSDGDDNGVYPLADMKAKDAIEVIEQTFNVDTLESWSTFEDGLKKPRKSVSKAIEAQLEAINDTEIEEEDSNEEE